jgi:microcystin-dependent protein
MSGPSGSTPVLGLPYPTPDDNVDVPRDIKALADAIAGQGGAPGLIYVGEIRWMGMLVAPAGWLACDGAAVSRTGSFARLFAAIGTNYGAGDGTSTFNVPDLRGRAAIGAGQGVGLSARAMGARVGAETVSLAAMPAHNHGGLTGNDSPDHNHNYETYTATNQAQAAVNADRFGLSISAEGARTSYGANQRHSHSIPSQGSGAADGNMPPALVIPAYIYAGA